MPISIRSQDISPTTPSPSSLASNIVSAAAVGRHDNDNPLWRGPSAPGPLGGVTQSMLSRFISCRERFRLKYILGLEPHDKWGKTFGYGNMWHACEEAHAAGRPWDSMLVLHCQEQFVKYPFQREDIEKWMRVCSVQFPEYIKYWAEHPDVKNRTPIAQEHIFDVPYTLPSGRVVRLRGKDDSVDLITDDITGPKGGIYLQENKTRGDIDESQVERHLKFDLQTMMYLIALKSDDGATWKAVVNLLDWNVLGVRYNIVRRPLSGGKGSIKPHAAKSTKTKITPAETADEFYERLRRDYITDDPAYWFFRIRSEVSETDIKVFKDTCLDPLLEQLCWWYDETTGADLTSVIHDYGYPPLNFRTPFGMYNPLFENGSTEYDAYMESGSEAGLQRVETLFGELQ